MRANHPRRLTPPAAPGALLKNFSRPAPVRSVKHEGEREPGYLDLVRQLPCLYCGVEPCGEAAHVKFACAAFGMSNMLGKRVADRRALPLCPEEHRIARHAQHRGNEEVFWQGIGINPYIVTEKLYAQRGDLVAMRAVVMVAIAERSKK